MSIPIQLWCILHFATLLMGARHNPSSFLEAKGVAASSTAVQSGTVLRGRYVLKEFLHRRQGISTRNSKRKSEEQKGSFPEVAKNYPSSNEFSTIPKSAQVNSYTVPKGESKYKHLGEGSFGDVWKAYDSNRDVDVAIKIFFRGDEYLTPKLARTYGVEYKLDEAKEECQIVIDVMEMKHLYREGAKHICDCFGEHISDAEDNDPLFLVLELCGAPMDEVYDSGTYSNEKPALWARNAIKQVLQGITFLNKLDPPLVHHDLKLENVVVTPEGDAKIIDWGSVMSYESDSEGGVCTPQYTPPEVLCGEGPSYAWPGNAGAFDAYSIGVMYWELLCNDRPFWDDDDGEPGGYRIYDAVPDDKGCLRDDEDLREEGDIKILNGLLERDPMKRLLPEAAVKMMANMGKQKSMSRYLPKSDVSVYARKTTPDCWEFVDPSECEENGEFCKWDEDYCKGTSGSDKSAGESSGSGQPGRPGRRPARPARSIHGAVRPQRPTRPTRATGGNWLDRAVAAADADPRRPQRPHRPMRQANADPPSKPPPLPQTSSHSSGGQSKKRKGCKWGIFCKKTPAPTPSPPTPSPPTPSPPKAEEKVVAQEKASGSYQKKRRSPPRHGSKGGGKKYKKRAGGGKERHSRGH